MSKSGFTLAELLLTIAVIGVVSSLVMPIVINNVQQAQYTSQAQNAYNVIS